MKFRRGIDLRIEPRPFSISDFTHENPFAHEVIENGVLLIEIVIGREIIESTRDLIVQSSEYAVIDWSAHLCFNIKPIIIYEVFVLNSGGLSTDPKFNRKDGICQNRREEKDKT